MTYFRSPYTSAFEDAGGRQYFWQFLAKTSLFGEFKFLGFWRAALALFIKFFLVWFSAFSIAGWILAIRRKWNWLIPLSFATVLPFASIVAVRIIAPFVCVGDFRYILPVIIPAVAFFVYALQETTWPRKNQLIFTTAILLGASVAFYAHPSG